MIDYHAFDLMVRGGSIALLALWSWLLFRDHREVLAGRMALAMNLSIVCHILASIPGPLSPHSAIDWAIELGSASVPALFWLFARAWFDDEQRIGWLSWLSIPVPMALVSILIFNFGEKPPVFHVTGVVLRVMMFSFAIGGLWIAWRGREGDLVETRRLLRTRMVGAVGAFVVLTNVVEIAVFNDFGPERWRSLLQIGILMLTLALCATMFGIRQPDLLGAPKRGLTPQPADVADDDPAVARLLAYMDAELPHRDEELTIAKLAQKLGEQEYRLRRLINGTLGHRNFAQFLNRYRLAEVKAALSDPSQREVPILTIALDAGFGSLGPFNRAFREAEGMTPSEYRAHAA